MPQNSLALNMRCITALPVGLTFDGVFPTVANLLRERPNGSIQLIILEANQYRFSPSTTQSDSDLQTDPLQDRNT